MEFKEALQIMKENLRFGSFKFKPTDNLSDKCNAPRDAAGVYVVVNGDNEEEIVYVGRSGSAKGKDIKVRADGIKGRFTAGKQFGARRSKTWPQKMMEDGYESIKVWWFITHDTTSGEDDIKYSPNKLECDLIEIHIQ